MKRLCLLSVRGKRREWGFDVWVDDKHLEEWREDGLDIHPIVNNIPQWIPELGLTRVWCWLQDRGILPL